MPVKMEDVISHEYFFSSFLNVPRYSKKTNTQSVAIQKNGVQGMPSFENRVLSENCAWNLSMNHVFSRSDSDRD